MDMVVNAVSRTWWLFLLQGVVSVVLGILLFVWPGHAIATLILLFGLLALINGVVAVFEAIGAAGTRQPWAWLFTTGVIGIIAGLAILRWPGVTALVLVFLVGVWALVSGIVEIVGAFIDRSQIPHAWLVVLAGVVSVIFGIVLLTYPATAALLTLAYIAGIFAIVYGVILCVTGFRVRTLPQRTQRTWQTETRGGTPLPGA